MQESENVLDVLENEIDGDWEKISKEYQWKRKVEIEKKENEKEKKWTVSLSSFIQFLKEIVYVDYTYDPSRFEMLKSRISVLLRLNSGGEILPESFHTIWKYFCDPRKYGYVSSKCRHCNGFFDVHYKRKVNNKYYFFEQSSNWESIVRSSRVDVFCPQCGHSLMIIEGTSKVVSVNLVDSEE